MERWLACFIFGALLALALPNIPSIFYIVCLTMSCITLLLFARNYLLTAIMCGFCYLILHGFSSISWDYFNKIDKSTIHQEPILIKGRIDSLVVSNHNVKYQVLVTHIGTKALKKTINIRLSWRKARLALAQNDNVELLVKLKPAHGLANVGSFSYQKWLLTKYIVLTGYIIDSKQNKIVTSNGSPRQNLYSSLIKQLSYKSNGLILALALGEKSEISTAQWDVLKATGTAHIMAISGLHLGLIAGLGLWLMRGLIFLLPSRLVEKRASYLVPIICSLILAYGYAYLAGFSLPTIRALIMLFCFWALRLNKAKVTLLKWLLCSLFCIVILDPISLLDPSLYLSLGAVCAIFFVIWRCNFIWRNKKGWQRTLLSLCFIQLALSFLLIPINMLLFKKIILLSFFANIIVVPFLSVTAIPIVLVATIGFYAGDELGFSFNAILGLDLSQLLFGIADKCLQFAWYYLDFLLGLSVLNSNASQVAIIVIPSVILCMILTFINMLNVRQAVYLFITFVVSCLSLNYVNQWFKALQGTWYVTVFDVGHGLAVMVEKEGKAVLYDTGASYPSGFSMADSVIVPYMSSQFIGTLDHVFVSHKDNDHSGGLPFLYKEQLAKTYHYNFNVQSDFKGDSIEKKAIESAALFSCKQGDDFVWQDLSFRFVWPAERIGDSNDESCVLEVSDGTVSILLPGDISKAVEHKLIADLLLKPVDILIAPHHGSKTSSSMEFITHLQPDYVVYSAGFLNRWKMPVSEVTRRYNKIKSKSHNTSEHGMAQFEVTNKGVFLRSYKEDLMPFWPWLHNDLVFKSTGPDYNFYRNQNNK